MTVDEIFTEAASLTFAEKSGLILRLQKTMSADVLKMKEANGKAWKDHLVGLAAKAMGLNSVGDTRSRSDYLARTMVAYELRREGYSLYHIGELLYRDHSTVSGMINTMKNILSIPNAWKDENIFWTNFQTLVKNETD